MEKTRKRKTGPSESSGSRHKVTSVWSIEVAAAAPTAKAGAVEVERAQLGEHGARLAARDSELDAAMRLVDQGRECRRRPCGAPRGVVNGFGMVKRQELPGPRPDEGGVGREHGFGAGRRRAAEQPSSSVHRGLANGHAAP